MVLFVKNSPRTGTSFTAATHCFEGPLAPFSESLQGYFAEIHLDHDSLEHPLDITLLLRHTCSGFCG